MNTTRKSRLLRMAAFYCICTLSLFGALYLFTSAIGRTTHIIKDFAVYGSESLLIMSPIWIIGKRWRWTACMAISLICLFLFANELYFRCWQDMLPLYSIFDGKSYNSLVFNSVSGLLRLSDLSYLLSMIIPIVAYRLLHIHRLPAPVPVSIGVLVSCGCAIIYIIVQMMTANAYKNYMRSMGDASYSINDAIAFKFGVLSTRSISWQAGGLLCYTITQIIHLSDYMHISLTDDEDEAIKRYIKTIHSNTALCGNIGKNLIFIIVESLNANVINKNVNGRPLTPVLNRLINEEGTVCCLNVITQVKDGGSSDGQMIYNTGLLPIKNGSAAMLFGDNTYKSLVTTLMPASSVEIIAEDGSIWNHRATSDSFGYDRLEENATERMAATTGISSGDDAGVFSFALQYIRHLREPFILEITTLSMHVPFQNPNAVSAAFLDRIDSEPQNVANYYRMTNYFDTQLGLFLEGLKDSGIYDKSVIVIASDHNVQLYDKNDVDGPPIVFIALNTGISQYINRVTGQIDVFPTVVDIMGGGDWNGIGISMFNTDNNSAVDAAGRLHGKSTPEIDRYKKDAWNVSNLIIRSNYFESEAK